MPQNNVLGAEKGVRGQPLRQGTPKDDYVPREYPTKQYFAASNGKSLPSYKNAVTPYDLPEGGSTKGPDNIITPYDMDPKKE
jgi:hypothetical protein